PCQKSFAPVHPGRPESEHPSGPVPCTCARDDATAPSRGHDDGDAPLQRRDFLALGGLGMGSLALPAWLGKAIAADQLLTTLELPVKKQLADAALQAARGSGASYCDVRIGRYLRQFVMTREDKVQNVVNTESTGVGVRVIV